MYNCNVWYFPYNWENNVSRNRYLNPCIKDSYVEFIDTKYRQFRRCKSGLVLSEYYNRYKNIVSSMLRKSKECYFKNKFDDTISDSRKTWNLLKDLVMHSSNNLKDIGEVKVFWNCWVFLYPFLLSSCSIGLKNTTQY